MSQRRSSLRHGAALLEVLVALVILATAGAAAVTFVGEVMHRIASAAMREAEVRSADAFMHAVALWSRDDLDRHLGTRIQGDWRMYVDRPWPSVYTVRLSDTATTEVLIETALYRPDPHRPPHVP